MYECLCVHVLALHEVACVCMCISEGMSINQPYSRPHVRIPHSLIYSRLLPLFTQRAKGEREHK